MVRTQDTLNALSNEEVLAIIHSPETSKKLNENLCNYLIKRNSKLVFKIARGYQFNKMELEDRIQEGLVGLYKAIQTFDISKGLKFSTHATHWIRGYILNNSSKHNFTMRLPNNVVELRNRIYQYREVCAKDYGYTPTDDEVSKALGIGLSVIKAVQNSEGGINPTSIDQPVVASSSGEELQISEIVGGSFLEDSLDRSEKMVSLIQFISELDDVDQLITNRILGLSGYRCSSFKELDRLISDESGFPLTQSSIRNRYESAVYYIRSRFRGCKVRTKINPYPNKRSLDHRDVVIVLNEELKEAYITGDLFYSQIEKNQILGFFLNNKETHKLVLHELTQAIHYIENAHRRDVDQYIDSAIQDLKDLGYSIINIQDFYPSIPQSPSATSSSLN